MELFLARDPGHGHDCFFDLAKIFTPAFFGLEVDFLGSLKQLLDGGVLKMPSFIRFVSSFAKPFDQGAQIGVDFEKIGLGRLAGYLPQASQAFRQFGVKRWSATW
jgi:hypothetical protein